LDYLSSPGWSSLTTQKGSSIIGLPIELAHEERLVWVALAEADNIVDDALQADAEHAHDQAGGHYIILLLTETSLGPGRD
jgi:hypothetical protein